MQNDIVLSGRLWLCQMMAGGYGAASRDGAVGALSTWIPPPWGPVQAGSAVLPVNPVNPAFPVGPVGGPQSQQLRGAHKAWPQ